jgi:opacity protein-like surface antigen
MEEARSLIAAVGVALAVGVAGTAAAAPERSGWYVGGGIGGGHSGFDDFNGNPTSDTTLVLRAHGGYRINPYLAVEGRLLGASNDSNRRRDRANFFGLSTSAVLLLPVTDVVDVFGSAGYYTGASDISFFHSRHEDGLVYAGGVGVSFGSRRQVTIRAEYEGYETDVLNRFWGVTGSFQYNFAQGRRTGGSAR